MTKRNSTGVSTPKQAKKKSTQRLTTAEFISKCENVHGNKYDYSKCTYINGKTKVKVFCKACNEYFMQTAGIHMRGSNCPKCILKAKTKTTEQFIRDAKVVHGNKYSYKRTKYKNKRTKVLITCSKHGDFKQTAQTHLSGSGCYDCAVEAQRLTTSEFIAKSNAKHGDVYGYELVEYVTNSTSVKIICKEHGVFDQMPIDHLKGNGCPECNTGRLGYGRSEFKRLCTKNNDGKGILYLIKCQDTKEVFYKIGITSRSVDDRFGKTYQMPYKYTTLYEITNNPDFVFDLEVRLKVILDQYRYEPKKHFKGVTECFSEIPKEVLSFIKKLEKDRQIQLIA